MRDEAETRGFLEANRVRMQQTPTPAEARLWRELEKLGGWERQRTLLAAAEWPKIQDRPYILDLFHPLSMVAVEVDGKIHAKRVHRDRKRDARLRAMGIVTLRFSNAEVLNHTERVVEKIKEIVAARSSA